MTEPSVDWCKILFLHQIFLYLGCYTALICLKCIWLCAYLQSFKVHVLMFTGCWIILMTINNNFFFLKNMRNTYSNSSFRHLAHNLHWKFLIGSLSVRSQQPDNRWSAKTGCFFFTRLTVWELMKQVEEGDKGGWNMTCFHQRGGKTYFSLIHFN